MSTSTTSDAVKQLMIEVDAMLERKGMEVNERNRQAMIQFEPSFKRRYRDWKKWNEEQKRLERQASRSITPQREAHGRAWAKKQNPPIEILSRESLERCVEFAELEFQEQQKEYEAAVAEGQRLHEQAVEYEKQFARDIMSKPCPTNAVHRKYAHMMSPLNDSTVEIYAGYKIDDLKNMVELAKHQATNTLTLMLGTPPDRDELAACARFIELNFYDPGCEENWTNSFLILQELNILRPRPVPTHVVDDLRAPTLPPVPEVVRQEPRTSGRGSNSQDVFEGAIAEIKAGPVGEYLDEIGGLSDIFISEVYNEMFAKRASTDRDSVRRYCYFNMKKRGGVIAGKFTDDEIANWTTDAVESGKVSSDEWRRQITTYGSFSLSRVPDKTQALLEQLVKQGRKS